MVCRHLLLSPLAPLKRSTCAICGISRPATGPNSLPMRIKKLAERSHTRGLYVALTSYVARDAAGNLVDFAAAATRRFSAPVVLSMMSRGGNFPTIAPPDLALDAAVVAAAAYGCTFEFHFHRSLTQLASLVLPLRRRYRLVPQKEQEASTRRLLRESAVSVRHVHVGKSPFEPSFAVVTDDVNRRCFLAFRGTMSVADTVTDVTIEAAKIAESIGGAPVGFLRTVRHSALASVDDALRQYMQQGYSVIITGHSLGGAAALLYAAEREWVRRESHVFAFGAPPCVTREACALLSTNRLVSIVNEHDVVPRLQLCSLRDVVIGRAATRTEVTRNIPRYYHPGKVWILRKESPAVEVPADDDLLALPLISTRGLREHLLMEYVRRLAPTSLS